MTDHNFDGGLQTGGDGDDGASSNDSDERGDRPGHSDKS